MASPPTYGSQCTPSLARASCIGSYLSRCAVSCAYALIVPRPRAVRSAVSSSSETGATFLSSYMYMHNFQTKKRFCDDPIADFVDFQ